MKARLLNHAGDDDGKQHATKRRTGRRKTDSHAAFFVEPCRDAGNGRREDAGSSDGRAHPLAEQELVVLLGDGCHHESEDVQERAPDQKVRRAIVVEDEACDRACGQHEEGLERRNPRHGAGAVLGQGRAHVIVLKDADAVDPPKRDASESVLESRFGEVF